MRSKKKAATPPPRVTRSRSNNVPIAAVIESEKKPAAVKSPVKSGKKIIINNVDSDDDDDDNKEIDEQILCDWGPVKCYFDGSFHNNYMQPSPCRRSGCTKFAHQACQDNWAAINSVTPFNVAYALCRDHHPQYCRFIEEINEEKNLDEDVKDKDNKEQSFAKGKIDNSADDVMNNNKQSFAKGNNDEEKNNHDDDDNENYFDV